MAEEPQLPVPEEQPHRKALAVLCDSALERWPELKPLEKWRREGWSQMKRGFQLFLMLVAFPLVCLPISFIKVVFPLYVGLSFHSQITTRRHSPHISLYVTIR